jgi:hypothetical protein
MTGYHGDQPDRVDWVDSRNLLSTDPQAAASVMTHTAARSPRVQKPVYHVSINWHHDDKPTPDEMRFAASRLLHDLGLEEHQVLMVAHRDTEHRHVHLMINRVHPSTHMTWDNKNDYYRLRASMARLEREMGWRPVGKAYRHMDRAADQAAYRIKKAGWEAMHTSRSWPELEERLSQAGLTLKPSGPGLVVTDGKFYVKASDFHRSLSRQGLERRFGKHYREWRSDVRKVQGLAKDHFHIATETPPRANRKTGSGASAPAVASKVHQARAVAHKARYRTHQARTALEGSGDLRLIEQKIASFAVRYGHAVLRRVSPAAAAILEAVQMARRALDRERSR